MYSRGKYPENDDADADNFVHLVVSASKLFGIQFKDPGFIICDSNINSWIKEIQKDVDKNGKPMIIVLLLNNYE